MNAAGLGNYNADRTATTTSTGRRRMSSSYPSNYHPDLDEDPGKETSLGSLDDKTIDGGEDTEVRVGNLARQLTRRSTTIGGTGTGTAAAAAADIEVDALFHPEKDSELDPFSTKFSAKKWATGMLDITSRDTNNPRRRAGFAFKDLSVHGFGSDTDYQVTVGNTVLSMIGGLKDRFGGKKRKVAILNGFDGLLESGEMLVVLGPPGSGCSTFLKTVACELDGIFLDDESYINYRGISPKQMRSQFRGEAIYTAEVDAHFPQLTVGQTLLFAAQARAPRNPPAGLKKMEFAEHMRDVMMAVFGISHTVNTRVGNDFIRGVSGGERKRVTIAEAALSGAPLQCWDNSTRGLDSANAIEFCKTIRMSTQLAGSAACVAIYQSPQSAYDLFDKVTLIYEGEQCYYGPTTEAKQFFLDMGFECPEQATTPDFLTSLTSPAERKARPGWEGRVPRTPKEFAAAWKASPTYAQLQKDLQAYDSKYPFKGEHLQEFWASRRAQQSKNTRPKSPYTLSFGEQVKLCLQRGFWRLKADPSLTFTQLFGNFVMALIVASVFFNLPDTTASFYSRGSLLFFAILLNAFASALEILTLYAQRPQVEKHQRYAFYHPSAEAVASMLTDMPYKITNTFTFNITLYFMTNLRRTAGAFFFYILISFMVLMTMSMFFRSIASVSRTLVQALAPAAVVILALLIYAGFAISVPNMLGWSSWIRWLNPVYYGLEALMINEFHGREFACSTFVPAGPDYTNISPLEHICSTVGAVAGSNVVNGDTYIHEAYLYVSSNKWRNFGILWIFLIGFCVFYLVAAENVRAKRSKGEVLVFPRGKIPSFLKSHSDSDKEGTAEKVTAAEKIRSDENAGEKDVSMIQRQTAIFSWEDVCYEVKIKKETRRILDHVDGWVKPGTLTALMGVSGAGKTTLLDVLASRVTMGVVTGLMHVDGRQRDASFARKTGYCMQQDLHLETSTVREALAFSAILRQPAHISHQEKLDYVEEVIKLLEMEPYADAVVGVPGEGLNVEQRKRLTIGVELVAKPELLLFLDEPSSGLDSQTSYAIVDLLVKLKNHGQAILCTIHQPSALLFERFDRLLFLAKGGRTVYFGPVGAQSSILTAYFEKNGGFPCPKGENPAEWMLQVIGAAPGSHTDVDWPATWMQSEEREAVKEELRTFKTLSPPVTHEDATANKTRFREFAAPFPVQVAQVTKRVWQQYWRTPSYIWSKTFLCVASALFIGFSFFNAKTSQSGLQNQLFAIFLLLTIFGQIVQQLMPLFVTQRDLYEVRERPSRTYSWRVFMLSNIAVEIPWTTLMAVLMFFCWYYPIGLYRNAIPTDAVNERGALVFLFVWAFMLFTSTFAFAVIAGISTAETGGNIANLLFSLCLIFCGVLASSTSLPGFWIFMYRISPFTYLVQGILGTALANTEVICAANEFLSFNPAASQTCGAYMAPYISYAGGYLTNPDATANCNFCSISSTNTFLAAFNIHYSDRWRDFGLMWVYIIFNVCAALGLYWLARVPKKQTILETPPQEQEEEKA